LSQFDVKTIVGQAIKTSDPKTWIKQYFDGLYNDHIEKCKTCTNPLSPQCDIEDDILDSALDAMDMIESRIRN